MSRAAQYGDDNAAIYDVLYPRIDREALACLRRLTGDGHALELGVGTGRYAAALAEAGTRVTGVDASIPMLQRCRMRSTRVQLIRGDLAALPFRSGFRLAYSLVSTLGLLPDRESQRRCLVGIAAALKPSGLYVDESTSSVQESAACLRPFECAVAIPAAEPAVYRLRYLPLPPPPDWRCLPAGRIGMVCPGPPAPRIQFRFIAAANAQQCPQRASP